MKVSSSSKKEPTTKVKKLEEELHEAKSKIKELKKENRLERKRTTAARRSRDNWKSKHKQKVNKIKGLKRRICNQNKPKGHHFETSVITLSILLRIVGGCSYRSIPRILNVLKILYEVPWSKIPCPNSVENWVSKMGLYQIENVAKGEKKKDEEVSLILDENLRLGNERMLLLLMTPAKKQTKEALKYEDVKVLLIKGEQSWTGEKIQREVEKLVEEKELKVSNMLSDEDSKLIKSARLLNYPHLPDIGHAVGKCLRQVFEKNEDYQSMIKLIGRLQRKSVNQKLTYLRPPKQRVKARFMNQNPLVKWGLTMLSRYKEMEEKEKMFFQDLKAHQEIFKSLNYCMELSQQILKPLKTKGLNSETLEHFKLKIEALRLRLKQKDEKMSMKKLVEKFIDKLEIYKNKYETFLGNSEESYPVSTDVIESLFGKHKDIISNNSLTGMTMIDLELAVHCVNKKEIPILVQQALEGISMTNLFNWRKVHSSENQALKRKL